MTNTPEGLPSRIDLPNGYSIQMLGRGYTIWYLVDPEGEEVSWPFSTESAQALAKAMNAPTPLESKLAEALEFYANQANYLGTAAHHPDKGIILTSWPINQDGGDRARAALEAWKAGR